MVSFIFLKNNFLRRKISETEVLRKIRVRTYGRYGK